MVYTSAFTPTSTPLARHHHPLGTRKPQHKWQQHRQQPPPSPVTTLQQSPLVLSSNWRKFQEALYRGDGSAGLCVDGKGSTTPTGSGSESAGVRVKREQKEQGKAEDEERERRGTERKIGDAWRNNTKKLDPQVQNHVNTGKKQEQSRKQGEILQVAGKKRKADNIATEDAKKTPAKISHTLTSTTTPARKMLSPGGGVKKAVQNKGNAPPQKIVDVLAATTAINTPTKKTKTEVKTIISKTTSTTTIPNQMKSIDSLDSPAQPAQAKVGKYLSLDCEMVGCGQPPPHERSQLARVSIVNFHGHVILDTFVRPSEPVTDWRTAISGVRPSDMATAISLDKARELVRALLRDRILVGHSVNNDLNVLGLKHPRRDIRDTSKLTILRDKYGCGRTPALRVLSLEILGLEIQKGEHSSTIDARACMLIYQRFRTEFESEIVRLFGKARPARRPPKLILGLPVPIVKGDGNQQVSEKGVALDVYCNEGERDTVEEESSEHEIEDGGRGGDEDEDDGQVEVGKMQVSTGKDKSKKKKKKKKKKGKYR